MVYITKLPPNIMPYKTKGDYMSTILNTFFVERNLSKSTIKQYKTAWKQYCQCNGGMSIEELINEADDEEEQGIRMKKRTLKTRLLKFRTCLIEQGNSKNSIINKMNQVKSVYRHYEIEIPNLPYLSDKGLKKETPIGYDDLPTKSIIREALDFGSQLVRSFILLQVSSGMGRAECLSLTICDFLTATGYYDENKSIREMLVEMYRADTLIVPTFKLKRQKVNEYYYTFATHECVMEIVKYLLNANRKLELDSPLFKVGINYINTLYGQINDVLGLGTVGEYKVFRTHMLRKFNATALTTGENALSEEEVDFLQGRSRGRIRESYMKKNPLLLKEKYLKAMDNVLINYESKVTCSRLREFEKNEEEYNKLQDLLSVFDVDVGEL